MIRLFLLFMLLASPAFGAEGLDWFDSLLPQKKGVAVIVHGLNLNPEKMHQIAGHLQSLGMDVLRVSLMGHRGGVVRSREQFNQVTADLWLAEVREAYRQAKERADRQRTPVFYVGYSLGGVLGELLLAEGAQFDRVVLFAPALELRWQVQFVHLLGVFGSGFELKSSNLPEYRANGATPMAAYRAMFDLVKRFRQVTDGSRLDVPTLVFLDSDDELVDASAIREKVRSQKWKRWSFFEVKASESRLSRYFHHLIVDSTATGFAQWKRMADGMSRFFEVNTFGQQIQRSAAE